MVGKGQRRREKNFRAAHGGEVRLPPAPKPRDVDALPSKLRRIMEFKNSLSSNLGFIKFPADAKHGRKGLMKLDNKKENKKLSLKDDRRANFPKAEDASLKSEVDVDDEALLGYNKIDKGAKDNDKSKRKRKMSIELQFRTSTEDKIDGCLSKKARKKKYLEEKKKKHKKTKIEETLDFPKQEKIKFGEVVEAPPKLTFPKASKNMLNASQERLRLQAIEEYRKRRGWASRPGLSLPVLSETPFKDET